MAFPWSCNLLNIATSDLNFSVAKIISILFSSWQCCECSICSLCSWYIHKCIRWKTWLSGKHAWLRKKNVTNLSRELLHDEQVFGGFFVLINFQLSAKHFSVLPCYFMKQEDIVEKRWILKLTLNFGGGPSDATSTFLKVACADGNFLYKDDFAVVITITDN